MVCRRARVGSERRVSLPGGPAEKYGNRFEALWTASRLVDLLHSKASAIRFEPPGDEGKGVEYWIQERDGRWFEQVKRRPAGTWTVRDLEKAGILAAFWSHLSDDPTHHARFVSTAPAHLGELTDAARASVDLQDLEASFLRAEHRRGNFSRVVQIWQCAPEQAREALQRIRTDTIDEMQLRRLIGYAVAPLIEGNAEAAVDVLAGLAGEYIGHVVTAEDVWTHLESRGVARPVTDTLDAERRLVEDQNNRYLRRVSRDLIAATSVPRVEAAEAASLVASGKVVLLHGGAGVGKSSVCAQVAAALRGDGHEICVLRLDSVGEATTVSELGRNLGFERSPATVVSALAGDRPGALLIDQLDAVSLYAGRQPEAFELVEDLLAAALQAGNVGVLLLARTYDLHHDPRVATLARRTEVNVIELGPFDQDSTRAIVAALGVDASSLPPAQIEMLRVPLHLAVFERVLADGRPAAGPTSLRDLYWRFWEMQQRRLSPALGARGAFAATVDAVAADMSAHQSLTAPLERLEAHAHAIDVLASNGVLVRDGRHIAFFHESFFDYAFARRHISGGGSALSLLQGDEQHLFRRSQVRQILEYERELDPALFRADLRAVLTSEDVRFHLKDVAADVAARVDATTDDWLALDDLATSDEPVGRLIRGLLEQPAWFDAADSLGRWEAWLRDSYAQRLHEALGRAAARRPRRVAELLSAHLGSALGRGLASTALIHGDISEERGLVDLLLGLVADEDAQDSDVFQLVRGVSHRLARQHPSATAELVGAILRRAAQSARNPFDRGTGIAGSLGEGLFESAGRDPGAFLTQVLPEMLDVMAANRIGSGPPFEDSVWRFRHLGSFGGRDALLHSAVKALKNMATREADESMPMIRGLMRSPFETARFLAAQAIIANPKRWAAEALPWLVADCANLELGWSDSSNWASRQVIESCASVADAPALHDLTGVLLGYYPAWELRADRRRIRGHTQYVLLSAIPADKQTPAAARRLGELERKFPDWKPTPPRAGSVAGSVRPPIPVKAIPHMTDAHWRGAILRYADEDADRHDILKGGPEQLAGLLAGMAETEPDRLARLVLGLPPDVHPAYLARPLAKLAETGVTPALFAELCRRTDAHSHDLTRDIAWALERFDWEQAPPADIVALLARLATQHGDPASESQVSALDEEAPDASLRDDLDTAAMNTTRGAALLAMARLVDCHPAETAESALQVARRAANDATHTVRTSAARLMLTLAWRAKRRDALGVFEEMLDHSEDRLFNSDSVERMISYIGHADPGRAARILERMLGIQDPQVAERAGRQAALAAFADPTADRLAEQAEGGLTPQRKGVAAVYAANVRNPALRSTCIAGVVKLFDDDDSGVREEASGVFRELDDVPLIEVAELFSALPRSKAVTEALEPALDLLEHSQWPLPVTAIELFEQYLAANAQTMQDPAARPAWRAADMVRVVLRLYTQTTDAAIRRRCLNVLDQLLAAGVYTARLLDDASR
jgi:hypothetical protein